MRLVRVLAVLTMVVAAAALGYAACRSPRRVAQAGELLTFERTACFGDCPAYKLVLFDDGRLRYEGTIAVADPGPVEVRIATPAIAEVRSLIRRVSKLTSDCCNCYDWTDSPSVKMSFPLPRGAEVKEIDHYHGCEKAPEWLYDMENAIDETLGTERWVGRKIEYRAYHPRR